MALAGLRPTHCLIISPTFAPSDPSYQPSKHLKLDPTPAISPSSSTEVMVVRTEEVEVKAGYCCPTHSEVLEQDFESEDEEVGTRVRKRSGKVAFLPEVPFEVKHYLLVKRDCKDVGTQPEDGRGPALFALASAEVVTCEPLDSTVLAPRVHIGPWHLPEYTQPKIPASALWNQFPEVPMNEKCPIECPHCSLRFASGQALGGHTSRRHSSKRPAPLKRLRRHKA